MLADNVIVKLQNRDNGYVGYTIPDLNGLHRTYAPGETKEITMNELRKLTYIPGGLRILTDCFIILDEAARAEILPDVEPEYYLDKDGVKDLLLNGSCDQLIDCLNFAPEGVISLIKDMSVTLELNDVKKREIILEKTGFNITKAIEINKETIGEDELNKPVRRAATAVKEELDPAPARRTATSAYKIVNKK